MKKLTAVSLFSGCGGFDLGLSRNGVDIIWANDISPISASAYKSLFPQVEFVNKDIRFVKDFPQADILIGCYPCTGFSAAARRRWKNLDDRDLYANDKNFLFQEFLRSIDIVKPKLVFIENVRGMLSAEQGFFINEQLEGLAKRGFDNIKPMLLNAADYGVPQIRQRVFIGGFHRDISQLGFNKPAPSHGAKGERPHITLREAIGEMDEWPIGEFCEQMFHGHYLTRNRKRGWDEPSFTIVAHGHHVPLHPLGNPMVYVSKDKWALQGTINRRLSWRECARVQGLPDHIEIDGSLLAKYKVVGNSVPPELARRVSEKAVGTLLNII
jgi:DNA (cytosine-5)-methyltransferase 1